MDLEPALRRSKREHQPSAKAASTTSLSHPHTHSASACRRSQRRRIIRSTSPARTPELRLHSSSVASKDLVSTRVDSVTPRSQQQRVRAAGHSGSNPSVAQGSPSVPSRGRSHGSKVLGRYTSHDCALLCDVILSQLQKQALAPTVLNETTSPAMIQWPRVAETMETTHKRRMKPYECQRLWKFLAYGEKATVATEHVVADSDEEGFGTTPAAMNAQVARERGQKVEKRLPVVAFTAQSMAATDNGALELDQTNESNETLEARRLESSKREAETTLPLFPTYSLPTGAPDAWYRPFGPNDAMPLAFVASRFLRRKTSPPVQSLSGRTRV